MKKAFFLFLLSLFVISAFSQNAVPLDSGFSNGVKYFEGRIAKETKLVVFNFRSPSPQLSEYIMEELTVHFVNSGFFTVVDRSNLELLQQEMAYQLSGEVSDETALAIGKQLGAQTIISGSIEQLGDIFRLRIRAIAVESAAIQGIFTSNIQRDRFLINLSGTLDSDFNNQQNNTTQTQERSTSQPSPSSGSGSRVSLPDYLLSH